MASGLDCRTRIEGLGAGVVALAALLASCGSDADDHGGSKGGGSCTTPDAACFEVSDPAGYDIGVECTLVQGKWSASACNPAGYARRCTEVTHVSTNDGPEQDVTYVYYWPEGSSMTCTGTEETL